MPTDTEMLERLKDAVDGVDFEESVTCDGDAILWAVKRIGELEGALKRADRIATGEDQVAIDDTEGMGVIHREISAVLSPAAPAKEGEVQA